MSEAALLDFDAYLGSLPDESRQRVEGYLGRVPEANRANARQRFAGQLYVAQQTGLPTRDVVENWDMRRRGFAEKEGGEFLAVKDDDAGFIGALRAKATKQRDERQLVFGPDDKTQDASDSLLVRAREAAYNGDGYPSALADWQATAKGKPGYDPARESIYAEQAATVHREMWESVEKVRPVADAVFAQLSADRGTGPAVENGGEVAKHFRGLTPDEKRLTFRLMADWSKGESDKLRSRAFWEAVGRGGENLFVGGSAAAFRSGLLAAKFREGDIVTRDHPAQEVLSDLASQTGDEGTSLGRSVEKMARGRKLTAEEAKTWNARLAEAIEDLDTGEELRKFGAETIDPTQTGGAFFRKLVLPVADSAAIMGSMMFSGSPVAALTMRARGYQNDEYLKLRSQGMDAQEADNIATVTGAAQAGLDQLSFGILKGFGSKFLPATSKALQQFAITGSGAARFGLNTSTTLAAEVGVELTQDHVIPALVQDLYATDPAFDVKWGDVWRDAAAAAPDVALGMVLLAGAGGTAQTLAQGRSARELGSSKASMRARGYSLEQIEEITAAPEAARPALLAEYLPAKAPRGEERKALVAEAIPLARAEQAAFEARTAAETVATSEAADYAIRVTRNGDGWQVTKQDGATVTVDAVEAARRIREDLRQASTQEEAAALVEIVDAWHAKAGEGTTRETTLTGERVESDGQTVSRTRGVDVVVEEMDARTLEALRSEALMDAQASGTEAIAVMVHGSNKIEFIENVAGTAREVVQRMELNQSESVALTAIHEQIEATWRAGVAQGTITRDETLSAVRAVAGALDPAMARNPEERAFRERVQRVAEGTGSETELRETVSELAVAEIIGRRKDGTAMPAGSVTAALDAALQRAGDAAELTGLKKFRALLRATRQWFRAVFGTVAALKKARRKGETADFDALIDKLLGLEQPKYDAQLSKELEEMAGATFRVTAGNRLELVMKQLDQALAKDPKKRRELQAAANQKLQKLQFDAETERFTPQGDVIRPLVDQRTAEQLDKEQAFIQADRAAELIAAGMSKREANNAARESAYEWRQEQDAMQKKDWRPRAKLVRDLRTLDAVLSVFPPEVRGKVGGFVKLATLASDNARAAEIKRRIQKLSGLLEKHLQKESVEALEALIEQATPKGGPGEKPGGKIGVQGHRIFAEVGRVWQLTEEEAIEKRSTLAAAIEKETEKSLPGVVNQRLIDLLEQEQVFDMFADFERKSAAEMDKAVTWLTDVYTTGRNAWRAIEEQRAAEVASMQQQVIEAMGEHGGSLANRQAQKAAETEIAKLMENGTLDLFTFAQVIEGMLAPDHPLAKRWNQAARKATAQKTDSILSAHARFDALTRAAFGGVSRIEASRRIWRMESEQTIEIAKVEGITSETIEVPVEKIRQFEIGEADPAAFGLTREEVDDLVAQASDPDNARRKVLSVVRANPGQVIPAKLTEGEAIALTMLAKQEQYAANLARHGYSKEVLAQAEAGISAEGKALRDFFAREYREGYAPLAKLFREMFGIDLPQITNYSPASFIHHGKERDMDPFGGGLLAEGGFRAGFLKERKAHLAEPRLESAFSIWRGHVAQMEHWRAFAPFVREIKGALGNPSVKNAVQGKHGAEMVGAVQRWTQALEQNGLRERTLGRTFDAFFREVIRRQATLTLAWKGSTALKNLILPMFNSGARLPTGAWMRGFSRVMRGKVDVKAIWASPMIQRRINSGYSPEMRAAMASLFSGPPSRWKDFVIQGMEIHGRADAFSTAIGTAIAYDYHYSEGIKAGLSEEQAREQALIEAEDNIGRTAQPSEMMDRSLIELSMSPLEKMGFMFASEPRKSAAMIVSAWQQMRAGSITKAQAVQVFTTFWLVSGLGSALISAAWRDRMDDDDDEWLDWEHWNPLDIAASVALGPIGGIPLLNMFASGLQGFSNHGPFQPVFRGIDGIEKITDGDKAEPVEKTVNRVVDIANGAAFLLPRVEAIAVGGNMFKQLFNLVDSIAPDTESEEQKKRKAAVRRERKERREAAE